MLKGGNTAKGGSDANKYTTNCSRNLKLVESNI